MNRILTLKTAAVLGAAMMLAGCQADNGYHPNADPMVLSAEAAKQTYPSTMPPEKAPDMFYSVDTNGVITIYNAGDMGLSTFTVWVSKSFSLIVDKLPPHTFRSIAPETVFDNSGKSLTSVPVANFTVQIMTNGHLYDLPGPVHPMAQ